MWLKEYRGQQCVLQELEGGAGPADNMNLSFLIGSYSINHLANSLISFLFFRFFFVFVFFILNHSKNEKQLKGPNETEIKSINSL
jgi:hypothetical protein